MSNKSDESEDPCFVPDLRGKTFRFSLLSILAMGLSDMDFRAVHKYKDSREQFEFRTHKRLIDILKPSQKAIEALVDLELPAGVESEIVL